MDDMHMQHDMSGMNDEDMHMDGMMHMGNLRRKLWVSIALTIPIILLTPMMGMKLPFQLTFPGSDWVVLALGTILFFYGGTPFFFGARDELKTRKPAMMSLITMGISVAYIYSLYAVLANNLLHVHPHVMDFFWELATLIVIMLLGHRIEMNAVMNAGSAVDSLAKLLPSVAHRVVNEQVQDVAISDLKVDDHVSVRAGEQIPADGTVVSGSTNVDEAMVTGEAKRIEKQIDDPVIGGSVNGDGTFEMIITGTGETGYLAKVMDLVSKAQQSKSAQENMADKVAGTLFYAALTVAVVAFITWLLVGNLALALSVAVTVLIIACPHALGLAIPLVIARSTAIAARHGLLIRNRDAMERVHTLKYALMDKTGTLTAGNFKVQNYGSYSDELNNQQILALLAGLEQGSSHPLAVGVLTAAKEASVTPAVISNVKQLTGAGLQGEWQAKLLQLVSATYLDGQNLTYDKDQFDKLASAGNSVSYLVLDGTVIGFVAQGDELKPAAKTMIESLRAQEIEPVMLTGDNLQTAQLVAKQLGITEVHAQLLPQDKEALVKQYQQTGAVMMIGDGVNDAPSLARADIGVAIGSGTDVAVDSADVVLVRSDPHDVVDFLNLARKTTSKMTQNLWWGAGYNILAIPLAAGILAPLGFMLDPMVGAVLMSLSTVIVAVNAMTLRVR
ncbi:heavy metal translocating P-type ATPase [Furfurilactobacillus siliginis]|uniref:P-type Cu(+) transporter n=1 Tax=Furfurilactobacillus siliginis TaxID=348151 RepID=A0A0R2L9N3_9LACO|nr:heavy metal translocating P-type ATPase [Furfurilactobacillus siliginis]KRN96438.1 copper transporting atpase [Furfurilactobacillus siliginis]GEK29661.1 copper-translocating P-type ATPase [Furfurilactobacillus siliginis]